MHYVTNGSRYARFTDEDTCEVWDGREGWTFPVPADVAKFGPDWRACDDPQLTPDQIVQQTSNTETEMS